MTQWYEESFGREYLELYAHRDAAEARADIAAILRLLSPPKDEPLLDLCCGACRHVLILREMGFGQIVGLDLSAELLEEGAAEIAAVGGETGSPCEGIELVRSDMRVIPYENHFATVLSLFTSFGYFDSDEENHTVLRAVYRALKPGGKFLIDYLSRDFVISHLVEEDEKDLPGLRVHSVRCLTEGCRRVEKTTTVVTDSGQKRKYHESVRMYSEPEMREMLHASGFERVHSYGALDGRTFEPHSERLILVAEKGEH
jgi:ubiquinone/menaquinone biosynthesis C-methylase UbiE